MGKKFLLLITLFLLTFPNAQSVASEKKMFELDKEGGIIARVVNAPLTEALHDFCATFNLDIKGASASDESISLTITGGTFEETLKRLMRGYNYVLIQDATSHKPALILLGKAERSKYAEMPAPRAGMEPPAYAPIALPPGQHTLNPTPFPTALSVQGSASSSNPASGERQKQQDEEKIGPVMASARPAPTQSLRSSAMPPMPPNIPGLEPPPMPPTLERARDPQPSVVTVAPTNPQTGQDAPPQIPGENPSYPTSPDTPPTIPTDRGWAQPKPKPTVNLKDLTPPPMPN